MYNLFFLLKYLYPSNLANFFKKFLYFCLHVCLNV